ncbi:MAG: lactonase family protein [Pseudonocardia sp.]
MAAEAESMYYPQGRAVYVMTNQDVGNAVTVFDRAADGTLTPAGTVPTGGLGAGGTSPADPLGSQGALILGKDGRFLFAVDAGSNEVSVLAVDGTGLTPVDRVSSGGVRPVSLTLHDHLLYVLNSTDETIAGFTVDADGKLSALAGSTQSLIGGDNPAAPAQVGFTPGGSHLVVTEKGTDVIDVFPVDEAGRACPPVRNDSSGPVPFGFTFAGADLLIVSEASGATSSYRVVKDGTLEVISGSVSSTQQATCWVVTNSTVDPRYAYTSNTGSGSISGYRIDPDGALSLLDPDGRTAVTGDSSLPVDNTVSSDDQFLYVLTGGFSELTISGFRIESDGSLTAVPGAGGLPLGTQGIAAN